MLQNLHVKNLALINESEVNFSDGLNILSGETGAGKSIIIGSINLALGEKVPKEMIRENAEYALVELLFDVEGERQLAALERLDIYPEEGHTVILSRKIMKGRSVARINSETVTISKMREVAAVLIDIHGQHDHQSLQNHRQHLEILDGFAKEQLMPYKEKLRTEYQEYKKRLEELKESKLDQAARTRELSFLEFEIHEIEEAALKENEDVSLEEEYKKLKNWQKIFQAVHLGYEETGNSYDSASEKISRAARELSSVAEYDDKVKDFSDQILEIDSLLNDFNREIGAYLSDSDFDEAHFQEIEQRIDQINGLKAKYGNSILQIQKTLEEKQKRFAQLTDYDTFLEGLNAEIEDRKEKLVQLCKEITKIRQQKAKVLTKEIVSALGDLNFLDVSFEMEFRQIDGFSANGWDDMQFLISTNPGEPLKPLEKVASGGELSRIMLGIKTVLAEHDAIDTLIFDEIDAGISGRTAQKVSEKMSILAQNHQIICITHLPQIAAMADTHFLIEKKVENKTTISTMNRLDEKESTLELARMLGGVEITDTVIQSAKEMKELAIKIKKKKK